MFEEEMDSPSIRQFMNDYYKASDYYSEDLDKPKVQIHGFRIYEFNYRYVVFTPIGLSNEYIGVFKTLQESIDHICSLECWDRSLPTTT